MKIGLIDPVLENEYGYKTPIKSKLSFLHPKRHIPPTNPSDDINMSPCEGQTFSICRSMQNIQVLLHGGGVNKYVCKYIAKLDEQNYVVGMMDPETNGQLVKVARFLHNTKVQSTKINEEKSRQKRDSKGKYPEGRLNFADGTGAFNVIISRSHNKFKICFISIHAVRIQSRRSNGENSSRQRTSGKCIR